MHGNHLILYVGKALYWVLCPHVIHAVAERMRTVQRKQIYECPGKKHQTRIGRAELKLNGRYSAYVHRFQTRYKQLVHFNIFAVELQ